MPAVEEINEKTEEIKMDAKSDFYCKRVIYREDHKEEDEKIITKVAVLVGDYIHEKYDVDNKDEVISQYAYDIASSIARRDEDFFVRALFYKREPKVPCGILLGNYAKYINSVIGMTLYIVPRFRDMKLEEKLIEPLKYWAREIKKVDKVLVETMAPVGKVVSMLREV